MRWRSFCNELLGFAHELGVELVVILGALLGDTPHTRPVPVSGVTSDADLARTMDLEETKYEGPTGIVGILQEACTHAGVPAVSLWAAVPHYVSQPPNPKATLALLNRLEDLIDLRIPLGELPEDARAWQLGVDQLAAEDSEVAEYVQTLEEARDTAELPEASGEAIAREFERYLRRRDGGGPTAGVGPRDGGRRAGLVPPRHSRRPHPAAADRSAPSPAPGRTAGPGRGVGNEPEPGGATTPPEPRTASPAPRTPRGTSNAGPPESTDDAGFLRPLRRGGLLRGLAGPEGRARHANRPFRLSGASAGPPSAVADVRPVRPDAPSGSDDGCRPTHDMRSAAFGRIAA